MTAVPDVNVARHAAAQGSAARAGSKVASEVLLSRIDRPASAHGTPWAHPLGPVANATVGKASRTCGGFKGPARGRPWGDPLGRYATVTVGEANFPVYGSGAFWSPQRGIRQGVR